MRRRERKVKILACLLSVVMMVCLLPATASAAMTHGGVQAGTGTVGIDMSVTERGVIISGTFTGTVTSKGLIAGGDFSGTIELLDGADLGMRMDLTNLSATDLSYTGNEDYTHNSGTYADGVYTYNSISYLVMPHHTEYSFTLSADPQYSLPQTIVIKKNETPLAQGTDYSYDSSTGKVTVFAATIDYPLVIEASGHQHVYDQQAATDANLASALCGQQALYYYTCQCGEKGTATFPYGDVLGHDWGEAKWNWAEDYSGAEAAFTCSRDASHVQSVDAVVTSKTTEASGTKDGQIVYTAEAEFEGQTYRDTKTVVIPAAGTADTPSKGGGSTTQNGKAAVSASAPRTGDHSGFAFWLCTLLMAGAAVTGILVYSHKKTQRR